MNCLELLPCGVDMLDSCLPGSAVDSQKLHIFRRLTDWYGHQVAPLWAECYRDLHVELYRLMMEGRRDTALRAFQLSIVLLKRETRLHISRLVDFMKVAAADGQIQLTKEVVHCLVLDCKIANVPQMYIGKLVWLSVCVLGNTS